jgi:hypothetical protein
LNHQPRLVFSEGAEACRIFCRAEAVPVAGGVPAADINCSGNSDDGWWP